MDDNFIEEPLINYDCRLREAKNTKWNHISPTLGAHNYAMPHFVREPKCIQVASLEGKGFNEMTARVYGCEGLSPTIQTMGGGNREPKIVEVGNYSPSNYRSRVIVSEKGIAPAVMENHGSVTAVVEPSIAIPEATVQGYALAQEGDGVYINRPHQKRGVVQKQMIQTIKTSGDDIGVVVKDEHQNVLDAYNKFIDEKGYMPEFFNPYNNSEIKDISPTITTMSDRWQSSGTVSIYNNLRIRKLTPRECWRLMGIDDTDFDKAAAVCSNSQLYKQAGNGIVVDVFAAILKNLIEYQPKGKEKE
jgi:DNA (cytosine-5)-methyltransferase 1